MKLNTQTLKFLFTFLFFSISISHPISANGTIIVNDCTTVVIENDDSSITISGLSAPIVEVNVFDEDYNSTFYCLGTCNETEIISGLPASTYTLKVKYFDLNYDLICRVDEVLTLSGGPCTDADMDGICAEDDCNDNDANFPMTAGTVCDDNDFNTTNDQIQQDGCTCAGTPMPCAQDSDGDGVCAIDDCDDNDPNFPMAAGTSCDDGDANTENDEIQSDGCTCAGTTTPTPVDCNTIVITNDDTSISIGGLPTGGSEIQVFDEDYSLLYSCYLNCDASTTVNGLSAGVHHLKIKVWDASGDQVCDIDEDIVIGGGPCTDADMDGICAEDDCNDNDANFPMAAGTVCDDGDFNTANDQIQQDGCTCAGTPLPCAQDSDGDGVCAIDDCDDNDPNFPMTAGTSCDDGDANTENDEIQSDGCTCAGTAIPTPVDCNAIVITNDDTSISIDGLPTVGSEIQLFDEDYSLLYSCYLNCNASTTVNGLTAGEHHLKIKVWDASGDQVCDIDEDIVIGGGPCTDADMDGVCAEDDCNDNDANFPMTAGTVCDDGDANTENDAIQSDGCTCAGTPIQVAVDCDDIVITNDDTSITISGLDTPPISEVAVWDDEGEKYFYCLGNCKASEVIDGLGAGTYFIKIKFFELDYELICQLDQEIILNGGPCIDDDMDGVCAEDDCDDNNASFPMTAGTACDDGDVDTENDEIQSDGCTCEGSLIVVSVDCDDLNIRQEDDNIIVEGLDASPNSFLEVFDENWNKIFKCAGDCLPIETLSNLDNGTYFVRAKLLDENWDEICEEEVYLTFDNLLIVQSSQIQPENNSSTNTWINPGLIFNNSPDLSDLNMVVYPNPAISDDLLFVKLNNLNNANVVLRIYDNFGKMIVQERTEGKMEEQYEFQMDQYPAGLYLISIDRAGRRLASEKLILTRD